MDDNITPLEFRILFESVGFDQRAVGQYTGIRVQSIGDMVHGRRRISSRAVEWLHDLVDLRDQLADKLLAEYEDATSIILPFDPENDWRAQFCNHTVRLIAWALEGNGTHVKYQAMSIRDRVFSREFLATHPSADARDS